MRQIKELTTKDIDRYTEIAYDAYPSFKDLDPEAMKVYKNGVEDIILNDDTVKFYGMFDGDTMIAVMRLFDFETNLFGKVLPTSGIGFLGVSLVHKKQKAARDMLKFYEEYYREKGMPIGSLLPFRPDFYKKMGYGFGTKINKYSIPASRFPADYTECDIRKVYENEYHKLYDCHDRFVLNNHGMNKKIFYEKKDLLKSRSNKIFGVYDEDSNIKGYVIIEFKNGKSDNYTINNAYIHELVYDSKETLKQLLGFIKKQEDQVNLVIIPTCDENFYHLFNDPRNHTLNYIPFGYLETNTQGVGMMYKVFDVETAFKQCEHRNYNNQTMKLRLIIEDDFKDGKIQDINIQFIDGQATIGADSYDTVLKMKISDFSSLFMGVAGVKGLYNLGLLEIDNPGLLNKVDLLFYVPQKPNTNTDF